MIRLLRLFCLASLVAGAAHATDIEGISFVPRADGPGVMVRIHASSPVERYTVEQHRGRVEVTLFGAQVSAGARQDRAAPPVRRYTFAGSRDGVTVRFDVGEDVETVAYRESRSDDIIVTLSTDAPATVPMAPAGRVVAWGGGRVGSESAGGETPRPPVRTSPEPRVPSRRAPEPRRPAAPETRAPEPTVSQPSAPSTASSAPPPSAGPSDAPSAWRLDTIVLDAGHGNHDIGATYNGVREKDVTLAITRRLGEMIERELGVRVVYTRRGDTFEELRERGRIANRAGGKLFISVHANAAGAASARGTETYFLAPHRSTAAAEVMDRENSVIDLESDPSLYAEFSHQDDIMQAMAMSAFQEESQALAGLIEGEFSRIGRHSRGVKQAGFLVLWAASMPAVLVETGFVSNPDEARYLSSEAGQEETARAIFRSVAAYRDQYERGTRLAASQ